MMTFSPKTVYLLLNMNVEYIFQLVVEQEACV